MEPNYEDRNKSQIIRQDARGCFVESKSDMFGVGKVHLEFATYDARKPAGQRQINHVHIYIDMPGFLCLTLEAATGMFHARARQMRAAGDSGALYQCLGGTSAAKLKQFGRQRPDGMSLSRTVKLFNARKDDYYLFVADSGPGEEDAKGLIVPKFGNSLENHVAVSISWRDLNGFLLMTKAHYEAWLAAKYMAESGQKTQNPQNMQSVKQPQPQPRQNTEPQGSAQTAVKPVIGAGFQTATHTPPTADPYTGTAMF